MAPDYDFAPDEERYVSYDYAKTESIASSHREKEYGYQGPNTAKSVLDSKIYEHLSNLSLLIVEAKKEIEAMLRLKLLKKKSQGSSIVYAGIKEIFGDYIRNNMELNNTFQIFNYGHKFFYGLGFGLPLLVGNPDPPPLDCGLGTYYVFLDRYGLSSAVFDLSSRV